MKLFKLELEHLASLSCSLCSESCRSLPLADHRSGLNHYICGSLQIILDEELGNIVYKVPKVRLLSPLTSVAPVGRQLRLVQVALAPLAGAPRHRPAETNNQK